jgi:phosphoribosylformylglycinamidine cyclo-ligase
MAERGALDYRSAGVDLDAAERAKEGLKTLVASTRDEYTLSALGQFGGLYAVPGDVASPVLVSSTDGVGTKLKVAFMAGRHDTVGQDLVNHCVDDILVQGARPLFFLDYLGCGAMDESVVTGVVGGVARACKENGCALLGGETAEMPEFYARDEYDLAGFIVGLVERDRILDGSRARAGDALIGLGSTGLHTNGYTLARKIVFESMGLSIDDEFPGSGRSVADVLLDVHRSYLPVLSDALEAGRVRGLAHITGGGIPGNLPRTLGSELGAVIDLASWEVPDVFRLLGEAGGVERDEMLRVFNMGVGMIVLVAPEDVDGVLEGVSQGDCPAWVMGEVEAGEGVRWA